MENEKKKHTRKFKKKTTKTAVEFNPLKISFHFINSFRCYSKRTKRKKKKKKTMEQFEVVDLFQTESFYYLSRKNELINWRLIKLMNISHFITYIYLYVYNSWNLTNLSLSE